MLEPLLGQKSRQSTFSFSVFISIMPAILEEFVPIALADFFLDSGNVFNAYLLSHLSPEEDSSAAANIITSTYLIIVIIPSGLLYVISPTINHCMPDRKKAVVTASVLLALVLSIPGMIISFFMGDIFLALGNKESVCNIVNNYFDIFAWGLPLWMTATALNKTASPLDLKNIMYLESIINFIFMTGFSGIFVKVYPLPWLSLVQTIALSYPFCSIARILLYTISYAYLNQLEKYHDINIKNYYDAFGYIASMGWPVSGQLAVELLGIFFLSVLVSWLLPDKTMNLNILNVLNQIFEFSIILTLSMSIAAMNLTGKLCARQEYEKVKPLVNSFLIFSIIYNLTLFIFLESFSCFSVSFFMNIHNNVNTGLSGNFLAMFALVLVSLIFNAFKDIIDMSQRSLQIYKLPIKIGLIAEGFGLLLAGILGKLANLGVGGIFLGFSIGKILSGTVLPLYFQEVSKPERIEKIFNDSNEAKNLDTLLFCFNTFFKTDSNNIQTGNFSDLHPSIPGKKSENR